VGGAFSGFHPQDISPPDNEFRSESEVHFGFIGFSMCQLCIDAGWKQIKKPVEYQCDGMMYLWLFICANSLAKHKNKRSYRHFPMAALSRSPECDPVFTFQFNQ
jgi:hypothetical protein